MKRHIASLGRRSYYLLDKSKCKNKIFFPSSQRRFFASSNELPEQEVQESDEALKLNILNNALQYVPQFGWTVEALAAGAEEAGLPPVAHGVIERGPVELVEHFSTVSSAYHNTKVPLHHDFTLSISSCQYYQ